MNVRGSLISIEKHDTYETIVNIKRYGEIIHISHESCFS